MRRSALVFAILAVLSLTLAVNRASAQDSKSLGQNKVYRVQGPPLEGEVFDVGDSYEIVLKKGIKIKVPKTEVKKLEPVAAPVKPADAAAPQAKGSRAPITAEQIQEILGSDNPELGGGALDPEDQTPEDPMPDLTPDEVSIADMMRIAGPNAKKLETPHFVFIYTSELGIASQMAARLERNYRWITWFNKNMGLKSMRPAHKLEVFFFGTHEEFTAYQALNGMISMGILGFYMQTNNRSAFFDMRTYPPFAEPIKELNRPGVPGNVKREIQNKIEREMRKYNRQVVQHEAAHHIHFNLGTLSRMSMSVPRWVSEGMATMFETMESDDGASIGSLNHMRLQEFRRFYGLHGERVPDMRVVILNDGWFFANGGVAYSMGWALNWYLFKNYHDKYAKWCQINASREFMTNQSVTDRQRQFEDLFGEINDEWTKKFVDYLASLELNPEIAEGGP